MSRLQEVWSSHQKLLISHSKNIWKKQSRRHHFNFRSGFKIASNLSSGSEHHIRHHWNTTELVAIGLEIIRSLAPGDEHHRRRRRLLDQVFEGFIKKQQVSQILV